MFRLTWKKGGLQCVCVGMRNTTTGKLRGLTQEEVDAIIKNFKGPELLEEPITVHPFVPEKEPHASHG